MSNAFSEKNLIVTDCIKSISDIKPEESEDRLTLNFTEDNKSTKGKYNERQHLHTRSEESTNDDHYFIDFASEKYPNERIKTENHSVVLNKDDQTIDSSDEDEMSRSENQCNEGKQFICDYCGKSFSKKQILIAHSRTHSLEKPFSCDQCGKCFGLKHNLIAHCISHSVQMKDYICEICNKCFTEKGTLTKHYVIHTGEKPHKCDLCAKSFSYNWSLKRHYLTHTGERPHSCDVCNRTFRDRKTLIRHREVHIEKTFSCDICGNSFLNKRSLGRHYQSHELLQEMNPSKITS